VSAKSPFLVRQEIPYLLVYQWFFDLLKVLQYLSVRKMTPVSLFSPKRIQFNITAQEKTVPKDTG